MASVITTVAGLDMHYEVFHPRAEKTIVLLHGFTGSTKTWHHVIDRLGRDVRVFAIDLMGHGSTASPAMLAPYTVDAQIAMLEQFFVARQLTTFTLLGYSMGGRIALGYALKHPERIEKLILESASPGLDEEVAREKRRAHDNDLAERILSEGMREFVDYWGNIPLFESQTRLSNDVKAEVRAERLAQQEVGLANSLRGMGTGSQPSYWEALPAFPRPVSLITGELDEKFYLTAIDMQKRFENCSHHVANGCGHAIHVENPELFVTIVEKEF